MCQIVPSDAVQTCVSMQDVLNALCDFMLNLEHMAVLMALVNTRKGGQNALWRKKQYGKVIVHLQEHLIDHSLFIRQLQQVIKVMWKTLPAVQRLGSAGKEKLRKGSAIQRLDVMHLYFDSNADKVRENDAKCNTSIDEHAEDVDCAEADGLAAEDGTQAVAEDEDMVVSKDDTQSQLAGEAETSDAYVAAAQAAPAFAGAQCSCHSVSVHAHMAVLMSAELCLIVN